MEEFSGVVTTGIYCRPGCAGRPHERNVRPFALAAAAEAAGFRACLRCRPYRSEPVLTFEAPELVCRAVQLILDGLLDEHAEGELGSRLGVSPRHLRRLFEQHLGVTPDGLARSRRAHFARRLLDDTDLSVTDIAFASGFGSVRQFNRACREIFGAAPLELRGRRRRTDRLVADGGLALRLPFTGPVAWDEMLGYFADRAVPGVEAVAGGSYRRTVVVDGDPGVIEVGPGGSDHLVVVAHLPHWEGLIHLAERLRRLFGLDTDHGRALHALAEDPVLGPLIRRSPGLRTPGTWDPFETAVRAICGQRISVAAARTLVSRIVSRHGAAVAGLGPMGLARTFPSPAALAGADLDGIGLTGAGVRAVHELAAAVAEDRLALDRSSPLEEFVERLCALGGFGPWSAHYLALRIGYADAFPAADLGLRRALEHIGEGPVSPKDAARLAEPWRPWRSLAATHLWFAPRGVSAAGAPRRPTLRPVAR